MCHGLSANGKKWSNVPQLLQTIRPVLVPYIFGPLIIIFYTLKEQLVFSFFFFFFFLTAPRPFQLEGEANFPGRKTERKVQNVEGSETYLRLLFWKKLFSTESLKL